MRRHHRISHLIPPGDFFSETISESEDAAGENTSGPGPADMDVDSHAAEREEIDTTIKRDLGCVIEESFSFDGAFAVSQQYPMADVPNPILNIDGLGMIGLPLNEREARVINSFATPVGASGNDTGIWEIPAEKIHFNNPGWNDWVEKTVGAAATKALAAHTSRIPSFALRRLLVHNQTFQTTHYRESMEDDKNTQKIGDLIVLLPSLFEGAQLEFCYAARTKIVNFAPQSGLSISVIAAYSGVQHTLSGVSSGYRMSLVYDIVHSAPDAEIARPRLPNMQEATERLRGVLLSWKQSASSDSGPKFLACLLRRRNRSAPTFQITSLTGADELLTSHLRPVAKKLGFQLYLAHFEYTVTKAAYADDSDSSDDWGKPKIDKDDFVEDESSRQHYLEVSEIVDLSGMPVHVHVWPEKSDFIDGGTFDDGPHEVYFERDTRRSVTRGRCYKRTALLIWPTDSDIERSVRVGDIYDWACHTLQGSSTPAPTETELKTVERLLECLPSKRSASDLRRAVQALCAASTRWKDVQIFLRALKTCAVEKNLTLLGIEGFVSAYQAFGWQALKDFIAEATSNDPSIVQRRTLLRRLMQLAREEEDSEALQWYADRLDSLLRSLGKIDPTHIPWLAEEISFRGGTFLRDVISPQLAALHLGHAFWIPFLTLIHKEITSIPFADVLRQFIDQRTSELVQELPAFPTKDDRPANERPGTRHIGGPPQQTDSALILEVIQLCITTDNVAMCSRIFAKMREGAGPRSKFPPWKYYLQLAPALMECMRKQESEEESTPKSGLEEIFRPFFVDVVQSIAAAMTSNEKGFWRPSEYDGHQRVLVEAARRTGGISLLNESLLGDFSAYKPDTLQTLTQLIIKDFSSDENRSTDDTHAYAELISKLTRAVIDKFDTSSLLVKDTRPLYDFISIRSYPPTPPPDPFSPVIRLMEFCCEVGAQSECERLLLRVAAAPAGATLEQHLAKFLAPFLPVLGKHLVTRDLGFEVEPYKTFAANVVRSFAQDVVRQKPVEVLPLAQIQALGCGCSHCSELRAFFVSDKSTISFVRIPFVRKHFEEMLDPIKPCGVKIKTIRRGNRESLEITKPPSLIALEVWGTKSEQGKTLLSDLGDLAAQACILGDDYDWVQARIQGTAVDDANEALSDPQKRAAPTDPLDTLHKKLKFSE